MRLRRKVSSTTDSGLGTGQIVWNDLVHVGGHDIWYSDTATCYRLDGPRNRIPVGVRFSSFYPTVPGTDPAFYTI